MRLKSLELQGFKSFPDRTKINFDTGMTVVIGPNGSGKSNIADAIRWVLGEISSKNIRGTKMEDVIFGGTDNRRPMGYAEVSLTFDNTDRDNPLPVEYDEVTVTRKYYRAGESDYMINGKSVRLRDITELFMNTGLGKSGYSIIGQGRISEIISKKSEDRRGIFEEAAGISKYRYKKSEAERKLEKTDDNLSRVTDILSELEGRVGPLEKDAEKARKYLELYNEKKQLDVGLWLYEIDSIRTRSAKLQENYEISKHELEMADDSLVSLERQTELLFEKIRENQEKSENTHKEATRISEEKHKADAGVLLSEKDIQHISSELIRLASEIEKKTAEGKNALVQAEKLRKQLKDEQDTLASYSTALEEVQAEIEGTRKEIAARAQEGLSAGERTEQAKEVLQNLKIEFSTLERSKSGEKERKKELEEQMEALSASIKKTGEILLRSDQTLKEYKIKIEESKRQRNNYSNEKKELQKKQNTVQHGLENLRVRLNTVSERIKLLKRMEEHFEGYAGSVRYVMSKAAEGKLNGICGPVSKLIKVEERYATAIEIALGAGIQNIVTENEEAAKKAIEELKRSGNGRATFYPLTSMKPQRLDADQKKISLMDGFVGIANELITFDKQYAPVIDYLLGRTVVCETIDHASALSKAFGYKFRTVSLDGQVVNAGGSFTGGSVKKDGGILSRSREIEKLEEERESLKGQLENAEKELNASEERIAVLEKEEEKEEATLEIINVMYTSENTEHQVKLSKLESERTQLNSLATALRSLDEQMESYDLRKEELEKQIAQAEKNVSLRKDAENHLTEQQNFLEEKRNKQIEKKNSLIFEKGSLEKDCASTTKEIENITLRTAVLQSEVNECAAQRAQYNRKKEEYTRIKKEKEELSVKLSKELDLLESTDSGLRTENENFEKQSAEIRNKQREKTRHREIIFREYTKLEGSIESIKTEQDRYSSKLWDEYELTYAAAKELDYPEITENSKAETVSRQNKLRNRIRELGTVNVSAIEEYTEVKERYDFLSGQYTDLTAARNELNGIISGLEKDMKTRFSEIFSAINENFRIVFAELFGGGTAELSLCDPENILECGIEIAVAPPGKIIKSLSLLSGGEQVFVAIALFFAILRVNPAPFCLLDEIEAALDDVNVTRFATYAKNYSDKTQFIVISHRRGTMEQADTMYGVTMGERGISKVLPLHLNEIEAKTGLKV